MSSSTELRLKCASNSSQSGVGNITTPTGSIMPRDQDSSSVWILTNPHHRPGLLRLRTQSRSQPLTASVQGIYTCTISDSNGRNISINVGLYPPNFNSMLVKIQYIHAKSLSCHTEPPNITSLTYHKENRTMDCISTSSPATRVTWMKDGQPLTIDGSSQYSFSQTLTGRSTSTYLNVLSISETVQRVAGTYTCTVSNDLGSDSVYLEAVGEVQYHCSVLILHVGQSFSLSFLYLSSVCLSPLT